MVSFSSSGEAEGEEEMGLSGDLGADDAPVRSDWREPVGREKGS